MDKTAMRQEIEELDAYFLGKTLCCAFSVESHYNGDVMPKHEPVTTDSAGLVPKNVVLRIIDKYFYPNESIDEYMNREGWKYMGSASDDA